MSAVLGKLLCAHTIAAAAIFTRFFSPYSRPMAPGAARRGRRRRCSPESHLLHDLRQVGSDDSQSREHHNDPPPAVSAVLAQATDQSCSSYSQRRLLQEALHCYRFRKRSCHTLAFCARSREVDASIPRQTSHIVFSIHWVANPESRRAPKLHFAIGARTGLR